MMRPRELIAWIRRNRWATLGVVGVAALGAWVWWRRDGGTGGGRVAIPSALESGGQELGGFLGQYGETLENWGAEQARIAAEQSAMLQEQLGEWGQQFAELLAAIESQKEPVRKTPAPVSRPTPVATKPKPKPKPKPAPKPKPQYVTVKKYTSTNTPWQSTLSGIAQRMGTTVANLLRLNPSVKNPNLIHPGQKIRVK